MQIIGPIPILYVADLEQATRFYCDVLGFQCANRLDGWASLQLDHAEIMLSLPNEHLPFEKPMLTGSLCFRTENVEALWERLRGQVTIVYPIEDFEYGMREFAIRDLNSYVLQFGQEIDSE